jgi:hypothetical protein
MQVLDVAGHCLARCQRDPTAHRVGSSAAAETSAPPEWSGGRVSHVELQLLPVRLGQRLSSSEIRSCYRDHDALILRLARHPIAVL